MNDFGVIKIGDDLYPEKLKQINKPPKQLYYRGNIELLNKEMLAIVGTRNITKYGIKYAKKFAGQIANLGIPIISGMAIGTDTIAHQMALMYGTPTIAVLGTGLNNIYPEENINLYKEIIDSGGLVITEQEPETKYIGSNFALRNRIVSGLSCGVLVIEAGYRSGTSITIQYAKEQQKQIFAVPGRIDDTYSRETNRFIKEGAFLVTEIEDIIKHYPQFMDKLGKTNGEIQIKSEYLEIYNILKENNCTNDEIFKRLNNRSIIEINNLLTMMELDDIIEKDFGNGYKIKV